MAKGPVWHLFVADIFFLPMLRSQGKGQGRAWGTEEAVQGHSHPSLTLLVFLFFFLLRRPEDSECRRLMRAKLWLSAHREGRCRYQSIHWNKWEKCGVEANENDSVSRWKKCHPFPKDGGEDLITYFKLSLISTPGLIHYLWSGRVHCHSGARSSSLKLFTL